MKFTNTTSCPALAFEGLDQLGQSFHVVVMRQTYTWNDQGLLMIAEEQDPLRLEDQLVDPKDLMSGVVEESDLAHYKPKCDVIIKGHAYVPKGRKNQDSFNASIKLQTPDYIVLAEPNVATKYVFAEQNPKASAKDRHQGGQVLIDKLLTVLSPRYLLNDSIVGNSHYKLHIEPMPNSISLNPSSSFGGYSLIEDSHNTIEYINKNELIPEDTRRAIKLNPHHGVIAYLQEDSFNPAGTGYCSPTYYKYVQPQRIKLSQIHYSDLPISASIVNQVTKDKLDYDRHNRLIAGFGVRAKSHPERTKLVGEIDEAFIKSNEAYPKGFDFAMWNGAYPDQQTPFLLGNEWLTLTNLCKFDMVAATITPNGDTELRLYLPETIAYIALESKNAQTMATELPLRLDTVIISPDKQKVNLVWRAIIINNYEARKATLSVLDRGAQQTLAAQYVTETTKVIRPYEDK